jgi:hypothetical protein
VIETKKTAAKAAAGSQAARGTGLVAHLAASQEGERTRLSRMLHHDVAGMLAAARMDLSRLAGRAGQDAELAEQLRRIDQLLEQVIRDARQQMQRLHPALIDHFGLTTALRHLIEETCRARGITYTLEFAESADDLEPPLPIAVYRAVEQMLEQGPELREFSASLSVRRDAYYVELVREVEAGTEAGAGTAADDRAVLRTWLESLGATWNESGDARRPVLELRLPRRAPAA